jgi:hypothetical protein
MQRPDATERFCERRETSKTRRMRQSTRTPAATSRPADRTLCRSLRIAHAAHPIRRQAGAGTAVLRERFTSTRTANRLNQNPARILARSRVTSSASPSPPVAASVRPCPPAFRWQ